MTTVVTEVRGVEGSQCTQMESGSTNEAISVPTPHCSIYGLSALTLPYKDTTLHIGRSNAEVRVCRPALHSTKEATSSPFPPWEDE